MIILLIPVPVALVLTVMTMLPSFSISMTAQRSFAFPLRKRIAVAGLLRPLLNPATQLGRLQLPRHAATLIAKSKFQPSRCSTGPLRHPCLTSLLSSDRRIYLVSSSPIASYSFLFTSVSVLHPPFTWCTKGSPRPVTVVPAAPAVE